MNISLFRLKLHIVSQLSTSSMNRWISLPLINRNVIAALVGLGYLTVSDVADIINSEDEHNP